MKKQIILVEDDKDILLTLKIILDNAGYQVTGLTSARTIIEEKYQVPDLFILDKRMPNMDGLEVCRHLRGGAETQNIPIIVISASSRIGNQALKAGANDFLAKPFQMETLLAVVSKYRAV
jgi:DNA-binding response OmpR family regulator